MRNHLLAMPKRLAITDHFNIFPIGLAYVSAALKQDGHQVHTANLDYIEGDTQSILNNRLLPAGKIEVLWTGGLSRDYGKIRELLEIARRINPTLITVVGGGIVSSDPEPAMRALGADIGVIGEGEATACELARALDERKPYTGIPGLIFRAPEGALVTTPSRKEIADIDSIPFPDFDGFDYRRWVEATASGVLLTDRSCPFRCTFCFHPSGSRYRQRSLDNIFLEIDFQVARYPIRCIGLTTELFATSRQRIVDFCQRIERYGLAWGCCLRVSDLDRDIVDRMKRAGCINVVLGLESADPSVLRSMRKRIKVEDVERALELTYEAGIMIEAGFIFGDIAETPESVQTTLEFWRRHNAKHYLNLSMISVLPGSHLYEYACKTGKIVDRERFLREGCPLTNVSTLSERQYLSLRSLIAELRFQPHVPTTSFHIEEVKEGGLCQVVLDCRKCGNRIFVDVGFWFGKEVRCHSCTLINFVDPFEKALHRETEFSRHLPAKGTVALWGAGGIYHKLMQKYVTLASPRFVLVDGGKGQQGLTICGKQVAPPDVIAHTGIEHVVITALSGKDEICAALRAGFPDVKRVLVPAFDVTPDGIVPTLRPLAAGEDGETCVAAVAGR